LTGLDLSAVQIKTKIVSCHTANSKPVKQEVNGTMILPTLVFPAALYILSPPSLTFKYKTSLKNVAKDKHSSLLCTTISNKKQSNTTLNHLPRDLKATNRRHDAQHNDIQHNETQHKGLKYDTQHK
jgi:hypothetical protein